MNMANDYVYISILELNPRGWGVLPYLGMVGKFCSDDPHFGYYQSDWVPILYLYTIRLMPSFC